MIDRKAFWIALAFVVAMLAAAAWRVSLLPDWTHLPRYGVNGVAMSPISSAILFMPPGVVLFIMARLTWRARTARNPGESLQPWKKYGSVLLVLISVIVTLAQTFIITRSLGLLLTMSPRVLMVIMGLLSMAISNALPKLPWLQSRIAFLDLGPDKGAKFLRLQGWLGVLLGLAVVLSGLFLPFNVISPVVLSLAAVVVIMSVVFRFSGRRGQPQ
jgi:hypothetical protein